MVAASKKQQTEQTLQKIMIKDIVVTILLTFLSFSLSKLTFTYRAKYIFSRACVIDRKTVYWVTIEIIKIHCNLSLILMKNILYL